MRRRLITKDSCQYYELHNEDEYVPFFRASANKGQKVTVTYDHTNAPNLIYGYIYDGRSCGANYIMPYMCDEESGEVSFIVPSDGTVAFSGHHISETNHVIDKYKGKYLKVRIK